MKEGSEKAGLKLNIHKTKIMASGPITSWHIDGETMETVTDFLSLGSKITTNGECSHEAKRCLPLGRKAMTNLHSTLKKQRHWFANKGLSSQSYVFPVVRYGCKNWTMKKAECWRLMLLNCDVREDSWESLGLQGSQTSQSQSRSILNIHWKD